MKIVEVTKPPLHHNSRGTFDLRAVHAQQENRQSTADGGGGSHQLGNRVESERSARAARNVQACMSRRIAEPCS
jgi:hypothetical protein